ncbi:pirin family protein [Rhodocytophaga rosea]|uniref:Pirin family protein n=1 Tax=Rhodocytophaga rosea TaxID=2704465 RepID=A0A6C0GPJ1_9BACT|nr:pirin-like C-terminal cupin domain-containing protein [Rhodocytophaga rosea]QHT69985.1 pirin family protein [Rhodocytophaga rosea]
MSISRKINHIGTPRNQQGFLGSDHIARAVIGVEFSESDPFILLMDDMLDKQDDEPVGGPHPHAGFETVSLLLEGEIGDSAHKMNGGDFQLMTAGRGVVHTETIDRKVKMRLLQLWLTLPKKDRWAAPRIQNLSLEQVPVLSEKGVAIKVYSGTFAGLTSPVKNYVPLIIADITLQAEVSIKKNLPGSYTSFLYVLEGSVKVGEEQKLLKQGQVGWLDKIADSDQIELLLKAEENGARFVLYAAEPQGVPIVSHGPFIGDSTDDIRRLYQEFRHGKMGHISEVAESQQYNW